MAGRYPVRRVFLELEALEARQLLDGAPLAPLTRFASPGDFDAYFLNQALAQYSDLFGAPYLPPPMPLYPQVARINVPVPDPQQSGISQSDAAHIYVDFGGRLFILDKQANGIPGIAGSADAPANPRAIFVDGSRVTVVSDVSVLLPATPGGAPILPNFDDYFFYYGSYNYRSRVQITTYDVSNPALPFKLSDTELDGAYESGQMVGHDLSLVLADNTTGLLAPLHFQNSDGTATYESKDAYMARVSSEIPELVLPHYYLPAASPIDATQTGLVIQPTDVYQGQSNDDSDLVSIVTIDMNASASAGSNVQTLLAYDLSAVHAAANHIYLALGDPATDGSNDFGTIIQRIDLDSGQAAPGPAGLVPDGVTSSASMSEMNGLVYVATAHYVGGQPVLTAVSVLQQDGAQLDVVGSYAVADSSAQLQAVAFSGSRAFLDEDIQGAAPIHQVLIVDLTDANHPTLAGQFDSPNLLEDLDPLDANHLLTIGRSGDANFDDALTLYDVSDPQSPILVDQTVLYPVTPASGPGIRTEVQALPGSEVYFADQHILAAPTSEYTFNDGSYEYGTLVYHVDFQTGFHLIANLRQDTAALGNYVLEGDLYLVAGESVQALRLNNQVNPSLEVRLFDNPRSIQTSTLQMNLGATFNGSLLNFTVSDPAGLTAVINWGDGATSVAQIVPQGGQVYAVVGQHVFDQGNYSQFATEQVQISIDFSRGGQSVGSFVSLVQINLDPQVEYFLGRLYRELLGRDIEATALSNWSVELASGVSRTAVALSILNSQEYRSNQIQYWYSRYLGRWPDAGELAYWLQFASAGRSLSAVELGILGSPEYYASTGGQPAAYVAALYFYLLDRAPDAGESAAWQLLLDNGWSNEMVATAIAGSAEAARHDVYADFLGYLNRSAEAGGLIYFTTALAAGSTSETVAAAILGSSEYLIE
jgi:Beta propeller domain/Domain of unknown function (DUF4214)